MTSSCLLLLSVLFPLKYSVSAEATSCNGGLTVGQTGRGIDAGQVGSNVEDMVAPMHATSVQGSNGGGTTYFRSWKGHSRRTWHHRHLKNVRSEISSLGFIHPEESSHGSSFYFVLRIFRMLCTKKIDFLQLLTGAWGVNPYRMGNYLTRRGDDCKVLQNIPHNVQGMALITYNFSKHWICRGHNRMGVWDKAWKY